MHIGDVASLAGISVRTIRNYHRIGALAEPPRDSSGYRVYGVAELVRTIHIRMLSESGVPIREISGFLDGRRPDPRSEIARIQEGIRARIEVLERQSQRLEVISELTSAGRPLGLLPTAVTEALDACREDASGDPRVLDMVDRERDMMELLALTGEVPAAMTEMYVRFGTEPRSRAAYLELLRDFAAIEGRPVEAVSEEIDRIVTAATTDDALAIWMESAAGGTAARHSPAAGPDLDDLIPDPAQRRAVRRVLERLEQRSAASIVRPGN